MITATMPSSGRAPVLSCPLAAPLARRRLGKHLPLELDAHDRPVRLLLKPHDPPRTRHVQPSPALNVMSNSAPRSTLSSRITRTPPRLTLSAHPSCAGRGSPLAVSVTRAVTSRRVPPRRVAGTFPSGAETGTVKLRRFFTSFHLLKRRLLRAWEEKTARWTGARPPAGIG